MTRWYLKRVQPWTILAPRFVLVVEEREPPHRGFCIDVHDRRQAREHLHALRQTLAQAIARTDVPVRTFSPVEADERA